MNKDHKQLTSQNEPELKEDEVSGLVLGCSDYKEADGIIRLLTREDRLLSVYARGIQKEKSKNRRLALPFSKVRLSYLPQYSNSLLYLSRGSCEDYAHHINDDLINQSICFVIRDLITEDTLYKGLYQNVYHLWQSFNKNRKREGYLFSCLIASNLIKTMGIEPNFDGCVICGRTDHLVSLSREEGGLICSECKRDDLLLVPVIRLRKLRALFKARQENVPVLHQNFEYDLADFLFLCSWIEYHNDRSYSSIRFLETIQSMEQKKNRRDKKDQKN
ncbi:DNA repair protein RecO [Ileibacterium valens]|nr:DNA repair protein RecO [Ileibacterium valens]